MYLTILLFKLLTYSLPAQADTCLSWFQNLKTSPKDKSCVSKCITSEVDMSTFSCHNECETFCKKANTDSCSFNRQLVKFHSLPNKWPWSKSKNYKPSEKELDQLDEVLSSLNPSLIKNIEGFFIIERPSDIFSIGTPASYFEGQLIIYKSAFEDPIKLKNIIVHELGHHLHETTEKKTESF